MKKRAKAIMVVGTTSDSGKTLVAAALCRYFQRKGVKVAPYKAQNMALNSYVTEEGGEMGRAQIMQCEAAKIQPHTDMNPVLLKPQGNATSQVIVNGKVLDNITARDYYKKNEIAKYAREAYDRLAEKYELIILEGAGSPTELNILKADFVNMSAAEYADAETILVADIDRGGVFASIYGTIKLLPENYQKLFKGIIVNKFRGDISLLEDGLKTIEDLTGVPVLGVLPYVKDLQLDEEDSLGLEKRNTKTSDNLENMLDVAIIRLPHISNYTDFLPFENHPQIEARYVEKTEYLGTPDLIIIPGTKATCSDMKYLNESGLSENILNANNSGIPIIGICGGYQILGRNISDPMGIEGSIKEIKGLGLLDIDTTLNSNKELAQVSGRTSSLFSFISNDNNTEKEFKFYGYEIHSGNTINSSKIKPVLIEQRGKKVCSESAGSVSKDMHVFGCYVHGFFDSPGLFNQIVTFIGNKKGIVIKEFQFVDKDKIYDQLADLIEANISLENLN
jgi:adenosylcobyric acid synthase